MFPSCVEVSIRRIVHFSKHFVPLLRLSKHRNRGYRAGRSPNWVKVKKFGASRDKPGQERFRRLNPKHKRFRIGARMIWNE
jgi:hypothetical protein